MKNLRKFPRFYTNISITFLDRSSAQGVMVDASREGSLVIISSKLKPINAYVSFEVSLPDELPIKIVGKVIRHTKIQNKDAMGIQFLELASQDLTKWLQFLGKVKEDQEAIPIKTVDEESVKNDYPAFTLRFKSRGKLKQFFPFPLTEMMYFSSSISFEKGEKINITLVHPDDERLLHFVGVVQKYDFHPNKEEKKGLYCTFEHMDESLKKKIEDFV